MAINFWSYDDEFDGFLRMDLSNYRDIELVFIILVSYDGQMTFVSKQT